MLESLAADYRASDHDGATLQEYLQERGFATEYYYIDTAYVQHDT